MLGLKTHQEIDVRLCRSEESEGQIEKCIGLHLKHTFSTLRNIYFAALVTKVNALEHEL